MKKTSLAVLSLVLLIGLMGSVSAFGTWEPKTPMPTARVYAVGGAIGNDLYVLGGSPLNGIPPALKTLEVYDSLTDNWTTKTPANLARTTTSTGIIGDKLYVAGGCTNSNCGYGHVVNALEIYDSGADSWTTGEPMPVVRAGAAGAVVGDSLYVMDGFIACGPCTSLKTVYIYNSTTNSWSTGTPMLTGMANPQAAVIDGKIYVVGGSQPLWGITNKLHIYDPAEDSWTVRTPSTIPRSGGFKVEALNNKIYVMGGSEPTGNPPALDIVEVYDPEIDSWTNETPMSQVRYGHVSGVINNKIYAVGGWDTPWTRLNSLEVFTPEAPEPVCGNNIVEITEECDDGNTIDGDGCSSICTIEEVACYGIPSSDPSVCSSQGVCVTQDICVCDEGYMGMICATEIPPDADSDGVEDALDNCPADANSDQTDADIDGVGDVCDDDYTSEGSNIEVNPISEVTLSFSSVTSGGTTTITTTSPGPPAPTQFRLGTPPTVYDITTTADYEPPVTVCIDYNGVSYGNENKLKLMHHVPGWVDITDPGYPDTVNKIICGTANSFSYFAVMELVDEDNDGYTSDVDCNDNDAAINPGASDIACDGLDNNCNEEFDEGYVSSSTSCGIGACAAAGQTLCVYGTILDSCQEGIPSTEVCDDGIDNDCNGQADEDCGGSLLCDPDTDWKNHGQHVSCVAKATGNENKEVPSAAKSDVGKKAKK